MFDPVEILSPGVSLESPAGTRVIVLAEPVASPVISLPGTVVVHPPFFFVSTSASATASGLVLLLSPT